MCLGKISDRLALLAVSEMCKKEGDEQLPEFMRRSYNQPLVNNIYRGANFESNNDHIKASKSQGPDNIHPKLIKETKPALKKPLKLLFVKSLQEEKIPLIWNKANVTAIFKKGENCKAGNYRPISLTSVLGKLMETLI